MRLRQSVFSLIIIFLCAFPVYGAFTVSKSNGTITVTAGSGDLDDLVTAVADTAYLDKVGNVYVFNKGDTLTTPRLILNSGVTLNHTDTLFGLEWTDPVNNQQIWQVNDGACLTLSGNLSVNCSTTSDNAWMYNRGETYIIGDTDDWSTIFHYNRFYIEPTRGSGFVKLQYVNFRDPTNAVNQALYLNFNNTTYSGRFDIGYVDIDNTGGTSYSIYAPYVLCDSINRFHDLTITGGSYSVYNILSSMYFENCYFRDATNFAFPLYAQGAVTSKSNFDKVDGDGLYPTNGNYPMLIFDGCTFEDNDVGVYQVLLYYGSTVAFKDCTFVCIDYEGNTGILAQHDSEVLDCGGNTFTGISTQLNLATGSSQYRCAPISVTATDINGTPLDNACLVVAGFANNDANTPVFKVTMLSDSNGQFLTFAGTIPYFPYSEVGDNGTTRTISDYRIAISKRGYNQYVYNITFTGSETITAILENENVPKDNRFYDCTLYDVSIK